MKAVVMVSVAWLAAAAGADSRRRSQ